MAGEVRRGGGVKGVSLHAYRRVEASCAARCGRPFRLRSTRPNHRPHHAWYSHHRRQRGQDFATTPHRAHHAHHVRCRGIARTSYYMDCCTLRRCTTTSCAVLCHCTLGRLHVCTFAHAHTHIRTHTHLCAQIQRQGAQVFDIGLEAGVLPQDLPELRGHLGLLAVQLTALFDKPQLYTQEEESERG